MIEALCSDCNIQMYAWEDKNEGIEYTCPKCGYEDLPICIKENYPEYITQHICIHYKLYEDCGFCCYGEHGIVDRRLLLD